jgi:hypothetical protein
MNSKNTYWSCLRLFVLVAVALVVTAAVKKARADEPEPDVTVVHVLATDAWASEFMQDASFFTVYRTGPTNEPLTVHYRVEGTANNGVDYEELSGSVTFEGGASTALVEVGPFDDTLIEGNETVVLTLLPPLVDVFPPPYVLCWPSEATCYIEDNDFAPVNEPPVVRIANPPDGSVFEGPVDLRLIAHATDSDGRVLTVEFFDGNTSLGIVSNRPPIIIRPIPLADDVLELSLESDPLLYPDLDVILDPSIIRPSVFVLSWPNVPPGHHVLTAVATDNLGESSRSEPVEIKVTEPPRPVIVNVRATDPVATEPGPSRSRLDTATFTIGRTGPTDLPLTVYYRLGGDARNGLDYAELPYSVVIPRGATRTEVVIEPLDDTLVEGPEKVVIAIVPPICIAIYPPPPECYQVGRLDSARAVINDNDPANLPPVVEIVRPLDGTVYLAPVDITIVAQARDFDGRVVTVEFFEGTNSLGIVSNRPSLLTANTPQFALKWPDVKPGHYILTAEATDDDGAQSQSRPVEIKVVERTLPPVISVEATDAEAAEVPLDGVPNTATFTFKRTGPTDRALVVFYRVDGTAENGVDYRQIGTRVIIPSGASSAPVVVEPIDDRLVEGPESVGMTIQPPSLLSASILPIDYYIIGTNDHARAGIRDNDVAPSNQPPKVAIIHPNNGDIFVAPASIRICAEARDADGFVRSVEFFEGTNSLGVVTDNLPLIGNLPFPPPDQIFCLSWPNVRPGSYVLTARATDNRGAMSVSELIRIRVIEGSVQPVVTIEATDPFASEGDWILEPVPLDDARVAFIGPPIIDRPNIATFTVKRDRGTNIPLTVYYSLDGTAENGVDYRRLERSVVIPAGAWNAHIVVFPLDDRLIEGTETVIATLDPIACIAAFQPSPDCYLIGDPAKAVAYIRDNDFENLPPKVEITKPTSGDIFITPADIDVVATVRDLDGYVTEVEFFDGTNSIGKESRVYIIAPPPGEVHTFSIIWSNAPVGVHSLTAVATDEQGLSTRSDPVRIEVRRPGPRQVTIRATDPWASEGSLLDPIPIDPWVPIDVAIANANGQVALEPIDPNLPIGPFPIGPNNAVFTVSRNCCTNEDWVVRYKLDGTAENGVDYQGLSGVVRIIRGNWSAPIIVQPVDDRIYEGTETVECSLVEPCNDPTALWPYPCYGVGDPGKALAWIRDNDRLDNIPPKVAIVKPETGDQFRKGADIPIVVQTVDEDGWVGRMEFFADGRSIGVQEIYFIIPPPPGQLQRFSMVWSNAPAGRHVLTALATDDQGLKGESRPVVIEVIESPVIPVVNIVATDGFAREGTPNTAAFRIRRSGETNEPLTVHFAIGGTAENSVDYARLESSVTIPAGRRAAGVIITPIDDRRVERIETVILRLHPAALYNVGRSSAAGAIIVDNDHPTPGPICLPDRTFHARLKGANGDCYRLEISTDLREWEALDPNTVVDDAIHFLDCDAADAKARFYRVRPVSPFEVFSEE